MSHILQFLEAAAANLLGSLVAAGVVYLIFQRESARLEARRQQRDSRNLITAMLLQQFPVLIERAHTVQREAFTAAMGCYTPAAPHNMTLANDARLCANLLASVQEGAEVLGVSTTTAFDLDRFANSLARLSLWLARGESDTAPILRFAVTRYAKAAGTFGRKDSWLTHANRLEILLDYIVEGVPFFATTDAATQCALLCHILETIGHAAVLYGTVLRRAFITQVASLRGEVEIPEISEGRLDHE